jgi:hypothetical protein
LDEKGLRDIQTECFRGLEVDHQVQSGGPFDGEISWPCSLHEPLEQPWQLVTKNAGNSRPICHQPTILGHFRQMINRRKSQRGTALKQSSMAVNIEKRRGQYIERCAARGFCSFYGWCDLVRLLNPKYLERDAVRPCRLGLHFNLTRRFDCRVDEGREARYSRYQLQLQLLPLSVQLG